MKANGLMESSTIAAILLGSVAGVLADWHVLVALGVCAVVYGGAVIANLFIQTTGNVLVSPGVLRR